MVDRIPQYKNGKQKSALPNVVYESSGYYLPFRADVSKHVGVCVNGRWGKCFLCSLWMSPAERPQFQAVCPLDMLSGAESVPGRTGSRCPSSCQALPQTAEAPALPPPF